MTCQTFQTPDTFYLVAVDFQHTGFGSANDITGNFDQAVDDYAEKLDDGHMARVFLIEMDADNMPAHISEVTDDANDEIAARVARRNKHVAVYEPDPEEDNPDRYDERCDMIREAAE